jgi:hypothetical protein
MALNGILWFEEKEEWGRSYVDHLHGLAKDADAPEAVRQACAKLLGSPAPSDSAASAAQGPLVTLRSPRQDQSVIEATKDILAHAYAVVQRHGGGELP